MKSSNSKTIPVNEEIDPDDGGMPAPITGMISAKVAMKSTNGGTIPSMEERIPAKGGMKSSNHGTIPSIKEMISATTSGIWSAAK
jgi:hypothetical protein